MDIQQGVRRQTKKLRQFEERRRRSVAENKAQKELDKKLADQKRAEVRDQEDIDERTMQWNEKILPSFEDMRGRWVCASRNILHSCPLTLTPSLTMTITIILTLTLTLTLTSNTRRSRTKDLCYRGIPTSLRGKV